MKNILLVLSLGILACSSEDKSPVEEIKVGLLTNMSFHSPWGDTGPAVNAFAGLSNGTPYIVYRKFTTGECVWTPANGRGITWAGDVNVTLTDKGDSFESPYPGTTIMVWCFDAWHQSWSVKTMTDASLPLASSVFRVQTGAGDDYITCNGSGFDCFGGEGKDYMVTDTKWEFRNSVRVSMRGEAGNDRLKVRDYVTGQASSAPLIQLRGGWDSDCLEAKADPTGLFPTQLPQVMDCEGDLDWSNGCGPAGGLQIPCGTHCEFLAAVGGCDAQ